MLNFDPEFVFRTMQEVGVSTPKLHEMYDRLFKSKVRVSIGIRNINVTKELFQGGHVLVVYSVNCPESIPLRSHVLSDLLGL